MIRYRGLVVTIWVALTLFGFYANANIDSLLTTSITVPGSPSAKADKVISDAFGENTEGAFIVLDKYKNVDKSTLEVKVNEAAKAIPGAKVLQFKAVFGVLYANIQTNFDLQRASEFTKTLRQSLQDAGLSEAKVTGPPAIKSDVSPILDRDLKRGQLIAILVALVFLFITLRSIWSMMIPFIVAFTTISTAIGLIYVLAHKMLMVLYIPNIVELIGLGLAIDYSLLMVHRYKLDGDIKKTQRTILISGSTVAIALSTLIWVPVPFIRSLGIAGTIVPLVAIVAALTLQPALLSFLGREGTKPKFASEQFQKLGALVVKRPKLVLLISMALLALPISQVSKLSVTPSSISAIPAELESAKAIKFVTDRAGEGIISPIQVVISLPELKNVDAAQAKMGAEISKRKDVLGVIIDKTFVDSSGKNLRFFVISRNNLGDSQDLINFLRILKGDFPAGTKLYIGGTPSQGYDLIQKIKETFPLIALISLLISFLILRRFLASLLIPINAILLDLVSIGVAIGTVVFVMQRGIGVYKLEQIEIWTLLFIFAILFGLSMDYELFIVSRMRESYLQHFDNDRAIIEGLANTGGVVTSAALVMIGALTGFLSGHFAGLQELGVGLVAGIAIDVTIIRLLLLPASMALFGKWNWSHPRFRRSRTN